MSQPNESLLRHARREALLVLGIWLAAMVWTLAVSYFMGYRRNPKDMAVILGMPDWIAVGVILPWLLATAATIWFGLCFMQDDDLGAEHVEAGDVEA